MAHTLQHNKDAGDLLKDMPTDGPVHWEQLRPLLAAIAAAQVLELTLDGLEGRVIPGGIHIEPAGT